MKALKKHVDGVKAQCTVAAIDEAEVAQIKSAEITLDDSKNVQELWGCHTLFRRVQACNPGTTGYQEAAKKLKTLFDAKIRKNAAVMESLQDVVPTIEEMIAPKPEQVESAAAGPPKKKARK